MEKPFLKNYSNSQLIININGTAPHDHTTRTMISSLSAERHDTSNNLYNETPSSEPFNVDPDLVRVLNKNQEIIKRSQPRFTLDGKGEDGELESSSLIDIIGRTRLERLGRFPESERLYFNEFSRIIKLKYSSSCLYLKQRLNFPTHHSDSQPAYFVASGSLKEGLDYRVIRNEWPYAIPRDYQHMVVWSRLPLLDPSQARTPGELEQARQEGLSGFENLTVELVEQLDRAGLNPNQRFKPFHHLQDLPPDPRFQPALDAHIRAFVRTRWPPSQGFFNLMWFLNPIHLQSCPLLPHFHVFVKKL